MEERGRARGTEFRRRGRGDYRAVLGKRQRANERDEGRDDLTLGGRKKVLDETGN
jgi:hypothetical protein